MVTSQSQKCYFFSKHCVSACAATIKIISFFRNTQTAQQNPLNIKNNVWKLVTLPVTVTVKYKVHPDGSRLGNRLGWIRVRLVMNIRFTEAGEHALGAVQKQWTKTTCMLLITAKIGQCINSDLRKSIQVQLSNNFSLSITEGQ